MFAVGPHCTPRSVQVFGVQSGDTHWFCPLQKSPFAQAGHVAMPPH